MLLAIKEDLKQPRSHPQPPRMNSYVQALQATGANEGSRGTSEPWKEMRYEDLSRAIKPHQYRTDDLTAIYFYLYLTGNLGTIRRTLIKDLLKGQRGLLLNYNPPPRLERGSHRSSAPREEFK